MRLGPHQLEMRIRTSYLSDFDGEAFEDNFSSTTLECTLADLAMFYYESDLSSLPDNVPATRVDFVRDPNPGSLIPGDLLHQHMNTHTIGLFNNLNAAVNVSFPADPSVLNPSFWLDPDSRF